MSIKKVNITILGSQKACLPYFTGRKIKVLWSISSFFELHASKCIQVLIVNEGRLWCTFWRFIFRSTFIYRRKVIYKWVIFYLRYQFFHRMKFINSKMFVLLSCYSLFHINWIGIPQSGPMWVVEEIFSNVNYRVAKWQIYLISYSLQTCFCLFELCSKYNCHSQEDLDLAHNLTGWNN